MKEKIRSVRVHPCKHTHIVRETERVSECLRVRAREIERESKSSWEGGMAAEQYYRLTNTRYIRKSPELKKALVLCAPNRINTLHFYTNAYCICIEWSMHVYICVV